MTINVQTDFHVETEFEHKHDDGVARMDRATFVHSDPDDEQRLGWAIQTLRCSECGTEVIFRARFTTRVS